MSCCEDHLEKGNHCRLVLRGLCLQVFCAVSVEQISW